MRFYSIWLVKYEPFVYVSIIDQSGRETPSQTVNVKRDEFCTSRTSFNVEINSSNQFGRKKQWNLKDERNGKLFP